MSVLTVQAKKDAAHNEIKQQAIQVLLARKAFAAKKTDIGKQSSSNNDSRGAADVPEKKTKCTSMKNSLTKKELSKLSEQVALKKLREKSDRSIKKKSSKPSSVRRFTSSDGTVETACSSSVSSQWTLDDESFHSQLFVDPSTSFDVAGLSADEVFSERATADVPSVLVASTLSMDEVLESMLSKELKSQEERNERLAIIGSREHCDFYWCLTRQLYCMIASCEVLSTDMVMAGTGNKHGSNVVRSLGTRILQTDSIIELVRRTRPGLLIANSVNWVKKNLSAVPFIDAMGSIVQIIASLKDERDQYIAIQRVADFATVVSLAASTTGSSTTENGLRITVELIARTMVRARCFLPRQAFVEERSEFGKIKQYMLHLLGEKSTDTPAKEQAYKAASSVLAHIMTPPNNMNGAHHFAEMLRGGSSGTFHDVLVATTLNTNVEEIQSLPRFPGASAAPFFRIDA